jgi:glycosyltransferase involved in cell wall biosynthesis
MEKISVIIPTYNGSRNIKRAIQSVLNQDYPNIEVIVVDDASTDDTVGVVKSIKDSRLKIIEHKVNKNGSAARNTGIKASKGKYIALLDDDDEWLPTKLSKQVEYLEKKDSKEWKAVVGSYITEKNGLQKETILTKEGDLRKEILLMEVSMSIGSGILIEKKAVEEIGGFDEKYLRHQDLEFILRYFRKYKLATFPDIVLKRFGHSGTPSGEKILAVKVLYLNDFKKDIESFGKSISRKIYARQWLQVSKHFSLDGDFKNTLKYYFKSLSFAILKANTVKIFPNENYISIPFYLLRAIVFKTKVETR